MVPLPPTQQEYHRAEAELGLDARLTSSVRDVKTGNPWVRLSPVWKSPGFSEQSAACSAAEGNGHGARWLLSQIFTLIHADLCQKTIFLTLYFLLLFPLTLSCFLPEK